MFVIYVQADSISKQEGCRFRNLIFVWRYSLIHFRRPMFQDFVEKLFLTHEIELDLKLLQICELLLSNLNDYFVKRALTKLLTEFKVTYTSIHKMSQVLP